MTQLRQFLEEHPLPSLQICVVTFETAEQARFYAEQKQLPWPLLIDTERQLYRGYQMDRVGWRTLLQPHTLWMYLKLIARGRRVHRATNDVHQLGGDVLIDPQQRVIRLHVSEDPSDRPEVEELLAPVMVDRDEG